MNVVAINAKIMPYNKCPDIGKKFSCRKNTYEGNCFFLDKNNLIYEVLDISAVTLFSKVAISCSKDRRNLC